MKVYLVRTHYGFGESGDTIGIFSNEEKVEEAKKEISVEFNLPFIDVDEYELELEKILYNREVLINTIVYHWRRDNNSCGCGWAELGKSFPEHIANIYELAMEIEGGE